jgi:outer membrane receptor protein involved in Fe transport
MISEIGFLGEGKIMHAHRARQLLGASALGGTLAAFFFQPAVAQQTAGPDTAGSQIETVVVTSSRRAQDVTQIPYNVTAIGGDQLVKTGVASLEDLSRQIPNLVVTSSGDENLGEQRQVMRGLSISSGGTRLNTVEQNSVASYLGNAPYANYFQIDDIDHVEVLRGPQGTLYGSGAMGGAIRIIPAAPNFDGFSGQVDASVGTIAHSGSVDWTGGGIANIPIDDTFALRIDVSHRYSGGFIDQFGQFVREGGSPLGAPVLVDPADILHSSAEMRNVKDVNWSADTNARVAARWQPSSKLDVTLAFNYSKVNGYGLNEDIPNYKGGPDLLDPSVVYPATHDYQIVDRNQYPFRRHSEMPTLDVSYDLGFATLSGTSSYFHTRGQNYGDDPTYNTALFSVAPYYTGVPANPHYNAVQRFNDSTAAYTEEVRLVSSAGDHPIDYVIGAFYQHERFSQFWYGYAPGQTAYDNQPGVTLGYYGFGSEPFGPNDQVWTNGGVNDFTDESLYGELTWHVTDKWDITGGARAFQQDFRRAAHEFEPLFAAFGIEYQDVTKSNKFNGVKFKFNTIYEWTDDQRAYFTFSQGFRRGGANTFALVGPVSEPASLATYKPDSVDNYEAGLKGRLANGWSYTADVFYDVWQNPQLGGQTPANYWPVAVNGKEAVSKGLELEVFGELTDTLNFDVGYSYTDAKLTKGFCVDTGDGAGGVIPCGIAAPAGTPTPSSPKNSFTATLNYVKPITSDDTIDVSLNVNYKDAMWETLPPTNPAKFSYPRLPAYWLVNLHAAWEHGPITAALYARNLFDQRVVYAQGNIIDAWGPLEQAYTVGRPREVGIELTYKWE